MIKQAYIQALLWWLMPVLIILKILLIVRIYKGGKRIMKEVMVEKVTIECDVCGKKLRVRKNYEESGLRLHKLRDKKCKQMQEGCKHEWRLLNENVEEESRAIKAGYEEVCEICLELRGEGVQCQA